MYWVVFIIIFIVIFLSMFRVKYIYHINCDVIQGFPALRKAVTTHVKKYVDIANQPLTHHSPLAPLVQVDEGTVKPSWFSIQGSLSEPSWIMPAKTWKNLYHWKTVRFQFFFRRERKPKYLKKNRKLCIQWLWCWHFSRLRMKIENLKICHWPILAIYLKDFFCQ